MPAPRSATITAYGTRQDRAKLMALAGLGRKTTSTYLIELIRERYAAIYGDADPETVDGRTQQRRAP